MANEVIIEFKADTRGLESALKLLESTGQIDKKLADQIRADNKVWKEREDAIKKSNEEQKKAADPKMQPKVSKETISSFKDLKSVISEVGKAIGVAFATQQIIEFAKESLKAFQEAEQNALRLKSAVSVNGGLASDFEKLIDQSAILQETTIFSDDSIQQVQTMALQFGLTADQVEDLIPVITDFASATGQDLATALSTVISGVNGNARALKQYGVTLEDGLNKTEQLGNITEQLTKKFQGQAEAIGETSAGASQKLANRFDDLKEKMGGFIAGVTDSTAILINWALNGFQPVNDESDELTKNLFANENAIRSFGTAALSAQIALLEQKAALTDNAESLAEINKQLDALKAKKVTLELGGLSNEELKQRIDNLNAVKFKFKEQTDELKILQEEYKKRNLDIIISERDLTKLTDAELKNRLKILQAADKESNSIALTDAIDAVQKLLEIRKTAAAKLLEQRKKEKKEWDEFVEKSLKEQNPADANVSEKDRNNNFPSRDEFDKWQREFTKLQLDADKKREEDAIEAAKQRAEAVKEIEMQIAQEAIAGLFSLFTSGIEDQIGQIETLKQVNDTLIEDRLAKNKQAYDDELISARTFRENEKKLLDEKVKNEQAAQKKINDLKRQAAIAAKLEKVFEIVINTASNIVKNPLLAGFYAALGAVQTGVVLAQPLPKYHTGRLAKGRGEELAIIQKEETITDANKSKKYAPVLEAIHYGRVPAMALNDFVRSFSVKDFSRGTSTVIIDPDKIGSSVGWNLRGQERLLKGILTELRQKERIDYRSIR